MGTILGILIPLAYLVVTMATMRYVSTRPNLDRDDAVFTGVVVGIFWPLALPAFLMLYEPPKRQAQSEVNRKLAEQEKKEIMTEFAKANRPQLTDGRDEHYPWSE